jgi:hypothetical protein
MKMNPSNCSEINIAIRPATIAKGGPRAGHLRNLYHAYHPFMVCFKAWGNAVANIAIILAIIVVYTISYICFCFSVVHSYSYYQC